MQKSASSVAKKTKRQEIQERVRRRKVVTRLIWSGFGLGALVLVTSLALQAFRPAAGEPVRLAANAQDHITAGTPPGPYQTNPPTGGPHYETTLPARFYEENDLATLPEYPEGYLVHNLEHGHVIFWYNCSNLDEAECTSLKSDIRHVMGEINGVKVVAFPWAMMDEPLVMTSWDRIQRFDTFDIEAARNFVRSNRNRAPEPNAP